MKMKGKAIRPSTGQGEVQKKINPANTLILDFQPPEWWRTFLLFKLVSLWHFGTVALTKKSMNGAQHPMQVTHRLPQLGEGSHVQHKVQRQTLKTDRAWGAEAVRCQLVPSF
jgi:hypothetical protein